MPKRERNCIKCHYIHPDNGNCTAVGGFYTAVPAAYCPLIPELLSRAEAAEDRAEAAEKKAADACQLREELDRVKAERNAAVEQLSELECCEFCKNTGCIPRGGVGKCEWEWCGPQKENERGTLDY